MLEEIVITNCLVHYRKCDSICDIIYEMQTSMWHQ